MRSSHRNTVLNRVIRQLGMLALIVGLPGTVAHADTVSSAITYQGFLRQDGSAIPGPMPITMQFQLFDAAHDGASAGGPLTQVVTVTNGVFTTTLDFGAATFGGEARYLQVSICGDAQCNAVTPLMPRQPISATAYAVGMRPGAVINGSVVGGVLDVKNRTDAVDAGNFAIRGRMSNPTGAGAALRGDSSQSDGAAVLGEAAGMQGAGVVGLATAQTGTSYGVRGNVASSTGFAGHFVGGRNYFENNVGIGTDVPASKLHVRGNAGILNLEGADHAYIQWYPDGYAAGRKGWIGYSTDNDNNLTIASQIPTGGIVLAPGAASGVGIGTGAPAQKLDVRGQIQVQTAIRLDSANAPMIVRQVSPFTSGPRNGYGRFGMFMEPSTLYLGVPGSDTPDQRMSLGGWLVDGTRQDWLTLLNGHVGIGTISPVRLLDIQGPGNQNTFIRVDSGTTSAAYAGMELCDRNNPLWEVAKDANNKFYVEEPGVGRRLTIEQGGHVTIGASTAQNPQGYGRVLCVTGTTAAGSGNAAMVVHNPLSGSTWTLGTTANGGIKFAHNGNGTAVVQVPVLEVYGGSDLAEPFNVTSALPAGNGAQPMMAIAPGMVVSIDPQRVGELRVSDTAYDTTVAGIISGANGVKPGLTLRQDATVATGTHPVALSGRVYCWVDADAGGPVQAGDMLTTSETPGHAMKATDPARRHGAIIGKAMSALSSGKGLVLVLVNLQ